MTQDLPKLIKVMNFKLRRRSHKKDICKLNLQLSAAEHQRQRENN